MIIIYETVNKMFYLQNIKCNICNITVLPAVDNIICNNVRSPHHIMSRAITSNVK